MTNNTSVYEIIGMPKSARTYVGDDYWELPNAHVGVELELENAKHLKDIVNKSCTMWEVVTDDSLRNNGFEFIFAEPLSGADLTTALNEMEKAISSTKGKNFPSASYRTSTHVHIDVRDCTISQYMNIILLSIMFEPALFYFAGEDRQRNNFSMSSRFSTGYLEALSAAYNCKQPKNMVSYLKSLYKYSAINVTPPFVNEDHHPRKGSIEFRHHSGCVDMYKLRIWINILLSIKKAALDDSIFSPKWMHDLSSGKLPMLMKNIFGDYAKVLHYDSIESDCMEGARLVQEVIESAKVASSSELYIVDEILALRDANVVQTTEEY